MRVSRCEWDDANEEHVARHGVDPSEAEEVLRWRPYLRRSRAPERDRRYAAYGHTRDGRMLFVLFARREGGGVRIITARDMTRREREAYRRRRR